MNKTEKVRKTWEIPPVQVHYIGTAQSPNQIPEGIKRQIEKLVISNEARDSKTKREILYQTYHEHIPPYMNLYKNPNGKPTEQLHALIKKIDHADQLFIKEIREAFGDFYMPGNHGHWIYIVLETEPDIAFYIAMMAAAPTRLLLIPMTEDVIDEEGKANGKKEYIGFRKCMLVPNSQASAPVKMGWQHNFVYRM